MGKIPEQEYLESYGHRVITLQLLLLHHTPEEVETFNAWFSGQTGIIMEDGTIGFYVGDYERWLREGQLDRQLPYSWD